MNSMKSNTVENKIMRVRANDELYAGVNSDDHSSIIDQLLVAMFSIHCQHLVARSVDSTAAEFQTCSTKCSHDANSKERHGSETVVHTQSSSIVPKMFIHTTSGIIDN